MNIVDLSKNTMEEVRNIVSNSDKYSLIDFYAFWCEPCIMLNPVLEKIADNYNEDITVYRVDVDKNPAIADEYNITNVPTLVLQNKDEVITNVVGYNTYDRIDKTIQDVVKIDDTLEI